MFPIRTKEINNIGFLVNQFADICGADKYSEAALNYFFLFLADVYDDIEVSEADFFNWFYEFGDFEEMIEFFGEEPEYEVCGWYCDGPELMPFKTFRWARLDANTSCFAVQCPYSSATTAFTPLR